MERDGRRGDRKTSFHDAAHDQPAFERISNEEIRIRGIDLARQILRGDGLRQAGFMAELASRFTRSSRATVLFQEGEAHRKQRSATARFLPARSGPADEGSPIAWKPDELWRWCPSVSRRRNRSARKRDLPRPAVSGPGIRLARAPTISSNPVAESYELRGAVVTCI